MAGFGGMIGLGLLLVLMGCFNMGGNLTTIHWYHRRNVREEDRRSYGRSIGGGTAVMGAAVALTGALQLALPWEGWYAALLAGIAAGLGLILYGQLRYNGGIF